MMNYEASKLNLLTFDRNRSRYVITKVVSKQKQCTVSRYSKPTISPEKETKNLATKCPQYAKPVKWALSFIFQQAAVSNIVVMQFPTILDTVNMMNDNREIQLNL